MLQKASKKARDTEIRMEGTLFVFSKSMKIQLEV